MMSKPAVIIGAGPIGLTLAHVLAPYLDVVLWDPKEQQSQRPVVMTQANEAFLSALTQTPVHALATAAAITSIQIGQPHSFGRVCLQAEHYGLPFLGVNLPLDRLETVLRQTLPQNVIQLPYAFKDCVSEAQGACVHGQHGAELLSQEAAMVFACDGAFSSLGAQWAPYVAQAQEPQEFARVWSVWAEKHPQAASFKWFDVQGVDIAWVPQGERCATVIITGSKAAMIPYEDPLWMLQQVQKVMGRRCAKLRLESSHGMFPLSSCARSKLDGPHGLLMGSAAGLFPPHAAQGLNFGLWQCAYVKAQLARMTPWTIQAMREALPAWGQRMHKEWQGRAQGTAWVGRVKDYGNPAWRSCGLGVLAHCVQAQDALVTWGNRYVSA